MSSDPSPPDAGHPGTPAADPTPFSDAGALAMPHGLARMVHLPDRPDPVPGDVLARLPDAEAQHAQTLRGFRQVSFVGGRLALHAAMADLGLPAVPVLPDARGTPVVPDGWTGSVSHKRTLAIALVARARRGTDAVTVGIDLETRAPARLGVAPRVLRPAELQAIEPLPLDRRWTALLLRFSTKEAIYKAVDPWVRRWVGFDEAEVTPGLDGLSAVTLHLDPPGPPMSVEAHYRWLPGHVVTTVRIRVPATA